MNTLNTQIKSPTYPLVAGEGITLAANLGSLWPQMSYSQKGSLWPQKGITLAAKWDHFGRKSRPGDHFGRKSRPGGRRNHFGRKF